MITKDNFICAIMMIRNMAKNLEPKTIAPANPSLTLQSRVSLGDSARSCCMERKRIIHSIIFGG